MNRTKELALSISMFSILFLSCICSCIVPVSATEEKVPEKGLTILDAVIGLDLTKYNTIAKDYSDDLYFDTLPQERIHLNLAGNQSTVDMFQTFVNGKLQAIQVLKTEGSLILNKPVENVLEMTKSFLDDYSVQTKNSLYEQLESSLVSVDPNKNVTSIIGNTKLEVTTIKDTTTYRWTYTFDGIEAPDKYVALEYKNGFLKYFIDTWDIYKIGSTAVNLQGQEATDIAITKAKELSWGKTENENGITELKYNITNAMIWETIFAPSTYMDNAHSEDPFKLYPMHHIWISFDKFYPGNIYGANVYVWADTGEIGYIKERVTTFDPPSELAVTFDDTVTAINDKKSTELQTNSLSLTNLMIPAVVITTITSFSVYLVASKKRILFKTSKSRYSKFNVASVCILLLCLTGALILPNSSVNASEYQGRATIWGSESIGSWNSTIESGGVYGSSWRKTNPEVWQQQETAQYISNLFSNNGYDADNYQGDTALGSSRDAILAQIEYNEMNFQRVAVVDFNHGNGVNNIPNFPSTEFHYMFEDNNGTYEGPVQQWDTVSYEHAVMDVNISQRTILGNNTFFTFISTCNSAHFNETYYGVYDSEQGIIPGTDRARGMPYAWTHRIVDNVTPGTQINTNYNMSDDGYEDPDNGEFCYIGFFGGSAALNQTIENSGWSYHDWLEHFFAFALTSDTSINDALDSASVYFFGGLFNETALGRAEGFTAVWPMYYGDAWHSGENETGNGRLAVYGNGNIKLYQPLLTVNGRDSSGNPLTAGVEIDGEYVGTTSAAERVFATLSGESHTIEVTEPNGYDFQNFTVGANTYVSNPVSISVESDLTVTAYFTEEPPPQQIPVTFVIDSTAVGDSYSRYHAFTVDNQIPTVFWSGDWYNQNPGAIIGIAATSLHYETTKYLTEGYHNIEYAVSSYVGYWSVTIIANDQQVISQSTSVYNHATTQIYVTDNPPPTYTLDISYDGGGYTSPASGQHQYSQGTQVPVTAYDSGYWYFTHWTLDGNPNYNNPVTVTMNSNHNLQAHFTYSPPPTYHYIYLEVWGNYPPWTLMYQDSSYVQEGTYPLTAPPTYGPFTFYAWYYDNTYYYDLTIWVSVYSDIYIYALYY